LPNAQLFTGLLVLRAASSTSYPSTATFEVSVSISRHRGWTNLEFDAPVTSNVKLPSDLGNGHTVALPNSLAIGVVSADSAQA